jgi:hypothetical protein
MFTNPRKRAGTMNVEEVREARERHFEQLRQKKADEEAIRMSLERRRQPSNPWLYFGIVCGEGHLPHDYVVNVFSMLKQIAHHVDTDCEEYLIQKWPLLNIGTLKVLLFMMQQSDEKPNPQAITGLVKKVNDYLDKSDAHLEDYMVKLPDKKSTWEGDKTLEIFEQLITRLERRLDMQQKDFFDVESLFMRIYQKQQAKAKKKEEDEEPVKKRCRSSSM